MSFLYASCWGKCLIKSIARRRRDHRLRQNRPSSLMGEAFEERTMLSAIAGFEDVGATLGPESEFHGPDPNGTQETGPFGDTVVVGSIPSGGLHFNNLYSLDFGSWSGFAVSNITDNTTPGFGNQYGAYPGSGADGSPTYGVAYAGDSTLPTISLTSQLSGGSFQSLRISNTTYTALSMLNGDQFSKKFGGTSGNDPDYFVLTIEGFNSSGGAVGSIDFYLADYRFANSSQDYIVDDWVNIDLSSLTGATELQFSVDSSDVGAFGINTPAYFAIDSIEIDVPNSPPTVDLANVVSSHPEGLVSTNTKVADILITDDGLGTNSLSLSGPDASLFTIVAGGLYLRSGTRLDFETHPVLEVRVNVNDPTVGGTPDDFATLQLQVQNLDDEQDLILIDGSLQAVYQTNTGADFSERVAAQFLGAGATTYLLGNFTNDNLEDLVGISPAGHIYLVRNRGGGSFSNIEYWGRWYEDHSAHDINVGDFNGDGRDDLIARGTDGRWRLQYSLGTRFRLAPGPGWSPNGFADGEAVVGDWDDDGKDDVALRRATGEWFAGFGQSADGLTTKLLGRWNETTYSWSDIRVGDFNGDGRDDIAGRTHLGGVFFLTMQSGRTSSLRYATRWNPTYTWSHVTAADFNGDGRDDLLSVDHRGVWWLTAGSLGSTSIQGYGRWSNSISWHATSGDFNGDGRADIVGLDRNTGNWWMLFSEDDRFTPTRYWGKSNYSVAGEVVLISIDVE